MITHEKILVRLMALTICLSAFSVWQSTRASDDADEVSAQIRANQTQEQVWETTLQTYVDHDVRVLAKYCEFSVQHDGALYQLLGNTPQAAAVVPSEQGMRSLAPLLMGGVPDAPCSSRTSAGGSRKDPYPIARAEAALGFSPGSSVELEAQASHLRRQERWLITAGLLFAISMFGLIGIDALRDRAQRPARLTPRSVRRGQRLSLALAALTFMGGLLIVVWWVDGGYGFGIAVLIALVACWQWGLHWRASRSQELIQLRLQHPQWWAEVIGALTLVAFSAAALGLAFASGQERQTLGKSDAERLVAGTLSEQGQLTAMRDLDAAQQIAVWDGQVAAANLRDDTDSAESAAARRDHTEALVGDLESSVRAQLSSRLDKNEARRCPRALSQPEFAVRDLLSDIQDRGNAAVADHVLGLQESAGVCNAAADATSLTAQRWSSQASAFTIALVFLGLSGFLLALAADPARTAAMANWLLWVGTVGAGLGLVAGFTAAARYLDHGGVLDGAALTAFSRDVARGQASGCDVTPFDRAIARAPSYGPAYAERSGARMCESSVNSDAGMMTSDVEKASLHKISADYEEAMRLGPRTTAVIGDRGWAHILSGLHGLGNPREELMDGLRLTRQALSSRVGTAQPAAAMVGALQFNDALATAALGDWAQAHQAYRRAVGCLDPETHCPGGGIADPERRKEVALWALADLELLPQSDRIDRLREIVVGAFDHTTRPRPIVKGAELAVFPQEVQVSGEGGASSDAAVVWYFRPKARSTWRVLRAASIETLEARPENLGRPVSAQEVLPAGTYRADLYVGGHKVSSLRAAHEPAKDLSRVSDADIGVSLVVPKD